MALSDEEQFERIERKLDAIADWQRTHDLHHARVEGGSRKHGHGDRLIAALVDLAKLLAVAIMALLGQRVIT